MKKWFLFPVFLFGQNLVSASFECPSIEPPSGKNLDPISFYENSVRPTLYQGYLNYTEAVSEVNEDRSSYPTHNSSARVLLLKGDPQSPDTMNLNRCLREICQASALMCNDFTTQNSCPDQINARCPIDQLMAAADAFTEVNNVINSQRKNTIAQRGARENELAKFSDFIIKKLTQANTMLSQLVHQFDFLVKNPAQRIR
jgi:hypothetical protein